ncbi:MAG: acyltransferase family protein [Fluviibacter sp.]
MSCFRGTLHFAANILFWRDAGGYFDVAGELKPLLHLWSLGVEEQFYIVWPLLLWFVWKKRFNALTVTLMITVVSLIYALIAVKSNLMAAFYSPASRTWELLLGALLAYWNLHQPNWLQQTRLRADAVLGRIVYTHKPETDGRTLRDAKALLGLILIIVGIFIISKERRFPGGWALMPTIGAFLLLAAGPNAWANRKFLSNKLLVWVGLISYPLYLWHWPLLSFARIMEGETPSRSIRLAAVALSFVLAWLTYRLIERPIRWGKGLTAKAVGLSLFMAVVCAAGFGIYYKQGEPERLSREANVFEWPKNLNQNVSCKELYPEAKGNYCNTTATKERERIILIGDSHANHIYPGLAEGLPNEMGITLLGKSSCAPFANSETIDKGNPVSCVEPINIALKTADYSDASTVILAGKYANYFNEFDFASKDSTVMQFRNSKNPSITSSATVFEIGMRESIKLLKEKKVVFVLDIPELGFDPKNCLDIRPLRLTRTSIKSPCAIPRTEFESYTKPYRDLVTAVAKDFPNVTVFDAAAPFCDDEWCWAMKDGQMLYRDDHHLSVDGSKFLAKELIKVLSTQ